MNQVYLSGIVADPPIRLGKADDVFHAVFQLCVSHKTGKGEWHRELYTINSWNAAAQWVLQNLKQGQRVALLGYLTQRSLRTGDGAFVSVEVTSQEFIPMETKFRHSIESPVLSQAPDAVAQSSLDENQEEALAG